MYRLLDEDGLFQQWIIKEPAKISGYQRVWNGMFMCGKSKWVIYQSGTIGVSLAAENEGSVTTLCRRRTSARRAFRISFSPGAAPGVQTWGLSRPFSNRPQAGFEHPKSAHDVLEILYLFDSLHSNVYPTLRLQRNTSVCRIQNTGYSSLFALQVSQI